MKPDATPCNPHALPCVYTVMEYLSGLSGHGILTGQHTKTRDMDQLRELQAITSQNKIALIGEIGTIPSPDALQRAKAAWISYMTWCGDFCLTADYTDEEALKNMYHHPWAVTKDQLPTLY